MKNKKIRIIVFFIVMVAITGVGAATTSTYNLTHSNSNALNNSVNVTVVLNNQNNNQRNVPYISVQLVSWPSGLTPLGIDQFFYNIANDNVITVLNGKTADSSWTLNSANAQADGFGIFASNKSQDPAGTDGVLNPIFFDLTNTFSIPITPNDHQGTIAVHVRFDNGCSGWISDGFVSPGSQTNDCSTPHTEIPEFPSIALPVSASIGLVFFFYYRKRKEEQE